VLPQLALVLQCNRWVNCLLIREVPFPLAMRLWDTYLAEGPRMKEFLIYVLAAFVLSWSSQLKAMDFQAGPPLLCAGLVPQFGTVLRRCRQPPCGFGALQELVLFLQRLPTAEWGEHNIESVLSRAYMWRASFNDARSHLSGQ
jgi:TBC1 domain family member 2